MGGDRRRRVFWLTWAGWSLFMVGNNIVNALSVRTELARSGRAFHGWEPFCWELTSAAVSIALFPLVAWLWRKAPLDRSRWMRFLLVHAPATAAYSLMHVLGFHILRRLVYLAMGETYDGALDLGYEYPKDLRTYVGLLVLLWIVDLIADYWGKSERQGRLERAAVFDIRDGAQVVRAAVVDILAVSSAGNYVEFHLADGRKPLMRATLAKVESQLSAHDFVRTHRSWLVNRGRVTRLKPEGSGDWSIELGALAVPLSRRFKTALERLKS
jgi:hypothetical protein